MIHSHQSQRSTDLPTHDDFTLARRFVEAACIVAAVGLILWHLVRLISTGDVFEWWLPVMIVAGALAADFASGMIHWTADTWGSESMPILGRRLVRPFRVHHVNPDDFLRRSFLDTNGDVAAIVAGILALATSISTETTSGCAVLVFLIAFCVAGLPTNQVHQWAHMSRPPKFVRMLQTWGLFLSRGEHLKHHREPYAGNYCIATGWCNRPLEAISFFRRCEQLVTVFTGLQPRADDTEFAAKAISTTASSHAVVSNIVLKTTPPAEGA